MLLSEGVWCERTRRGLSQCPSHRSVHMLNFMNATAPGHDGTDHENLVWPISLLKERCWDTETAFVEWSILCLAFRVHFLRHRRHQDLGDWFMVDLDWHDGILWLLGGSREYNRVRLIHIIMQSWTRSPRIFKQGKSVFVALPGTQCLPWIFPNNSWLKKWMQQDSGNCFHIWDPYISY